MKKISQRVINSNFLVSLSFLVLTGCGGGSGGGDSPLPTSSNSSTPSSIIDPSNANLLTEALVVPNSRAVQGTLPTTSSSQNRPSITRSEENVSYSSGSQVSLPFDYQALQSSQVSQLVFSVTGADSYFLVDLTGSGSSGSIILPINIPSEVSDGQFCIVVKLIDSSGLVSAEETVCISVVQPLNCDTKRVSGGEGLTSTTHAMGGNTGNIRVEYETFTVKDKIDVFQNRVWIAGTGAVTDRESIRTALDCSQATEALGYVGQNSEFLFGYDSLLGGVVEVVVSGCENNGTAWNYTASCPGDYGMCSINSDCSSGEACVTGTCVGEGVLRFSLTWSALADFDLYVTTPNGTVIGFGGVSSGDSGIWDVDNTTGGSGAVENIYFDSSLDSGNYNFFVDNFDEEEGVGSWTIDVYQNGQKVETRTGSFNGVFNEESAHFNYNYQP